MFINFSKNIVKIVTLGVLLLTFGGCAERPEPASVMSVEKIALNGYDPVAYFVSAKPYKADGTYSYTYEGVRWYFETNANLEAFKAKPETYLPAFGGFCAYSLAEDELSYSNPLNWYIHNEKLYLFKNANAKDKWFAEIDMLIPAAQKQWELILHPVLEK